MKNYTFTELLITITIFSIGATLLAGAVRVKNDAKSIQCQSHLKKLSMAAISYANSYSGYLPAGMTPNNEAKSMRWENALANELKSKLLKCPANTPKSTGYGANYCYNKSINAKLPFYYFDPENLENSKISKYARQLPEIVLFGDAVNYRAVSPRQIGCRLVRDISGDGVKDSAKGADYNYWAPKRHNNSWNYVAADGSVHLISFTEWQINMNNSGIFYNSEYDF